MFKKYFFVLRGDRFTLLFSVVLLSLFFTPAYLMAQQCDIDYNKPTIAAGTWYTVGLKEDGTVVTAGGPDVSSWTNIKAISARGVHTVGLKEDGTVVTAGGPDVSLWTNIKAVSAGYAHTVGLKEDGTVVAVGYNGYGQTNVSSWTNIKAISAGYFYHTVGLKEDGTVVAVGYNGWGQMDVSSWTNIKAISAGEYHTVGLKEDGTVVAVGYNWGGDGRTNVSSWTNIKAIAAGRGHTIGLKDDGTIVTTGWSDAFSWTNITAVAAGEHTVGIKEDSTVVAGGANFFYYVPVSDWTNIRQPSCLGPTTTVEWLNQTTTNIQNAAYVGTQQQQNALLDKINTAISAINANPPDTTLAILVMNDFYKILCNMKKQGKIDENTYNTLYNDYVNILKSIGQTPKTGC